MLRPVPVTPTQLTYQDSTGTYTDNLVGTNFNITLTTPGSGAANVRGFQFPPATSHSTEIIIQTQPPPSRSTKI